jgi:hypothetical protein
MRRSTQRPSRIRRELQKAERKQPPAAIAPGVGNVIVLPDNDHPVLVNRVRLGHGGLIFTTTPAHSDAPEQDQLIRLTAEVEQAVLTWRS